MVLPTWPSPGPLPPGTFIRVGGLSSNNNPNYSSPKESRLSNPSRREVSRESPRGEGTGEQHPASQSHMDHGIPEFPGQDDHVTNSVGASAGQLLRLDCCTFDAADFGASLLGEPSAEADAEEDPWRRPTHPEIAPGFDMNDDFFGDSALDIAELLCEEGNHHGPPSSSLFTPPPPLQGSSSPAALVSQHHNRPPSVKDSSITDNSSVAPHQRQALLEFDKNSDVLADVNQHPKATTTTKACPALTAGSYRFGTAAVTAARSRTVTPTATTSIITHHRRPSSSPQSHDIVNTTKTTQLPQPEIQRSIFADEYPHSAAIELSFRRPLPSNSCSSGCSHQMSEPMVVVASSADDDGRRQCSADHSDAVVATKTRNKRRRLAAADNSSSASLRARPATDAHHRRTAQPKELKKAKKALAARKYREDKNNQMRALEQQNKELTERVRQLEEQLLHVRRRQGQQE